MICSNCRHKIHGADKRRVNGEWVHKNYPRKGNMTKCEKLLTADMQNFIRIARNTLKIYT